MVVRVNEEQDYLRGAAVAALRVGERLAFTPAHVCPVINFTGEVVVMEQDRGVETWPVEARRSTQ